MWPGTGPKEASQETQARRQTMKRAGDCLERRNTALRRQRQEDRESQASLGYIGRPCLKNQKSPHKNKTKRKVKTVYKQHTQRWHWKGCPM
jgi:hypothetical protein